MENHDYRYELTRIKVELEPNEEVYAIIRKHWGRIFLSLIRLAILSIVTLVAISAAGWFGGFSNGSATLFIGILALWIITLIVYIANEWYSYKQSLLVITNQRLIDYQQMNFLARHIQTIDIYEVQSCSSEISPGLGVIFCYGQLLINTIGDRPIMVDFIPDPAEISGTIMRCHNLLAHGGVDFHHGNGNHQPLVEATNSQSMPTLVKRAKPNPASQDYREKVKSPKNALGTMGQQWQIEPYEPLTTTLIFKVPCEKLGKITSLLPKDSQPSITFIHDEDSFEVALTVPNQGSLELEDLLRRNEITDILTKQDAASA